MSIILNIDTAVQTASVCLASDGKKIGMSINPSQKDHAGWLQQSINELLFSYDCSLHNINAIAISAGPGSYTGLRVGMATAKGLCYALQIPLITVSTLQMMAFAALDEPVDLLCPMIDARRMEVFTAVYDKSLNDIIPPFNCILNQLTFKETIEQSTVLFFGNGSNKFKEIISHPNAIFNDIESTAEHMIFLSYENYRRRNFADLAYSEPYYGKEFFSPFFNKAK